MRIDKLYLNNFRNYQEENFLFDEKMNIFIGENAQGKTNILEAVSYLALTFSFRDALDAQMIRKGENNFYIKGEIADKNGEKTISAAYSLEKKKIFTVDNNKISRFNDILGKF